MGSTVKTEGDSVTVCDKNTMKKDFKKVLWLEVYIKDSLED